MGPDSGSLRLGPGEVGRDQPETPKFRIISILRLVETSRMVIGSPVALPSDPELAAPWLVDSVQTRQTGLTRSCGFSGEIGKIGNDSEGLATSGMARPVRRTIHPNLIIICNSPPFSPSPSRQVGVALVITSPTSFLLDFGTIKSSFLSQSRLVTPFIREKKNTMYVNLFSATSASLLPAPYHRDLPY